MELPQAIAQLQDRDDFKIIEGLMHEFIETHVQDLSDIKNAENPQLLAYLAGGISAMKTLQSVIEEHKTNVEPSKSSGKK
jgi:uncharacterized protein YicC (UPF0701 family)